MNSTLLEISVGFNEINKLYSVDNSNDILPSVQRALQVCHKGGGALKRSAVRERNMDKLENSSGL